MSPRPVFLGLLLLALPVLRAAEDRIPTPEPIGHSSDGHLIVRLGEKVQVYELEAGEKSYRQTASFWPASDAPLRAMVTDDGKFIVTLDTTLGMGRGDVVVVYDRTGRKVKSWKLDDILQPEDRAVVISTARGEWWRQDAVLYTDPAMLVVAGPSERFGAPKRRYWYALDLTTLAWAKKR
ncbi:hypothetical protein [Opitutus sp. ER46]|uniref:hypothetical protein n=1 Tax=Opitutus sp. ER46 TaxID=2161864 RepID=UPI000D316EDE|nr:hypothetical protein [Opitutus sp. ER46]PTX96514.1 hypothetical protein DB354_07610 [Opitutus sp. ER46]